jgi:glucoamylase
MRPSTLEAVLALASGAAAKALGGQAVMAASPGSSPYYSPPPPPPPPPPPSSPSPSRALDDFIARQSAIAWDSLLCNVGPGECVPGAVPGVVVASPDTVDPPYFYTWTRDAALVMKYITDVFLLGKHPELERRVQAYAETQARLQPVVNPSGSLYDGAGLGEAKFKVDLRPFLRNWGRPQRDGPALRAIAMMGYAKHLVAADQAATAREFMWPVIRNDLAYVAQYWNSTGFDLWEEVRGSSFFTTAAQHRALVEGAALAEDLGVRCDACTEIAPHILCFLDSYWSAEQGHVVANIHNDHGRSGIDINTVLASIHNFDPSLGCDATTLQPCSDRALANHKAVANAFRAGIYAVNDGAPAGAAVAVGRYPEDVYYDGNPWYLATLAAAEQLYDALAVWRRHGAVDVTPTSLPFFRDLVPDAAVGVHDAGSPAYDAIAAAVAAYADGFVDVVRRFTPHNGSLSEQFDKADGEPLSAHDLTWSYASFMTATARRAGVLPRPWATPDAARLPLAGTCAARSIKGRYAAPSRTSFPPPPPPGATQLPRPTETPCPDAPAEVPVEFRELVETRWGESVRLVGNVAALGAWDVDDALLLTAQDYESGHPVWKVVADLPWGEVIEYKFVRVAEGGAVTWEGGANHMVVLPEGGCPVVPGLIEDRWREV